MARRLPSAAGLKQLHIGKGANVRGIEIEFRPSVAIIAGGLDKLSLDIRSFREPLKESLVQVIIPSIQDNFHAEGRPKWPSLADATIARKGFSNILLDSGKLFRTMQQQNIWTITKDYLVLQDLPQKVWYGKVHQGGATFGVRGGGGLQSTKKHMGYSLGGKAAGSGKAESDTGSIPARPFVMLQPRDQQRIESIFRHWLDEGVQRAAARMRVR